MNIRTKSHSEAHRRLCDRIEAGLERDNNILRTQEARQPALERDFREATVELRDKQQALRRARAVADAANMITQLPLGRIGRIIGGGVSALSGVAAANEVGRLERIVAQLENQIRNFERELNETNRLIAQHRRLRDEALTAFRDSNCEGMPNII